MKVFKAIGAFFAKIGRWIKDTAWVQPLLIVGGIFAIIFSIPYIVDAVESSFDSGNEAENYYTTKKLSLNHAEDQNSEADKLFTYIEAKAKDETARTEEEKGIVTDGQSKYGDQFFVSFVKKGCDGCDQTYPGFEKLEQNWGQNEFAIEEGVSKDFKLYTIFTDEVTDDELKNDETSFSRYFFSSHGGFFEQATTAVENRPYYEHMGGSSSDYANKVAGVGEFDTFVTPTTFLFDFNFDKAEMGIADIIFNFDGKKDENSSVALARTLIDCWNHKGDFANENA